MEKTIKQFFCGERGGGLPECHTRYIEQSFGCRTLCVLLRGAEQSDHPTDPAGPGLPIRLLHHPPPLHGNALPRLH